MKIDSGRVSLWLEELRSGSGTPLLLLHELGGSSADFTEQDVDWPGPVYALDFSGHGRSGRCLGGGYSPEVLTADADAALDALGYACVVGVGLGGYVGVLLAGSRAEQVPVVAVLPGKGLDGGGASPSFESAPKPSAVQAASASHDLQAEPATDPVVVSTLSADPRPSDYAPLFAEGAARVAIIDDGSPMPPWWHTTAKTRAAKKLRGDFQTAMETLRGVLGRLPPRPTSFEGTSFNQVPDSENEIHSDEVAQQHGFEGALVPGVTVSAYLLHPAVEAWGVEWLRHGRASVVVKKPLYDRRKFRVEVRERGETAYEAELVDETGTQCATARVDIPLSRPEPPQRRGDAPAEGKSVPATTEGLLELKKRGVGAVKIPWGAGSPMETYTRDPGNMPKLLRIDEGGYANSSFLLGTTNWILAANVKLGPWLHLQTDSQHFAEVPKGSDLYVEAAIVDLFKKKGHEFVDAMVAAFLPNGSPVMSTRLRAIYKLRG